MTLTVDQTIITVIEPDEGVNSTVTLCFTAQVDGVLTREALFRFNLQGHYYPNRASLGIDFYPNISSENLTVPAGVSGFYQMCVDIIIIGDNVTESEERIMYDVYSFSPFDRTNVPTITIYIIDNDSK